MRIVALPGYGSIPRTSAIPLIRQALVLAGVKSTIDSACSAVGKLKIWLMSRFGNYLDFNVPSGILAWFFDDSKVGGFCPPNLKSGLVWAYRHMGFTGLQIQDEDAVKGATQAKPVRPTPAVSASMVDRRTQSNVLRNGRNPRGQGMSRRGTLSQLPPGRTLTLIAWPGLMRHLGMDGPHPGTILRAHVKPIASVPPGHLCVGSFRHGQHVCSPPE